MTNWVVFFLTHYLYNFPTTSSITDEVVTYLCQARTQDVKICWTSPFSAGEIELFPKSPNKIRPEFSLSGSPLLCDGCICYNQALSFINHSWIINLNADGEQIYDSGSYLLFKEIGPQATGLIINESQTQIYLYSTFHVQNNSKFIKIEIERNKIIIWIKMNKNKQQSR